MAKSISGYLNKKKDQFMEKREEMRKKAWKTISGTIEKKINEVGKMVKEKVNKARKIGEAMKKAKKKK